MVLEAKIQQVCHTKHETFDFLHIKYKNRTIRNFVMWGNYSFHICVNGEKLDFISFYGFLTFEWKFLRFS